MEDFPSNSQRPAVRKEAPKAPAERNIVPVVTGKAVRRKRSLGKRMREAFIGDDDRTLMEFLAQDVIMPNIRNLLFEAGQSSLERSLFGSARPHRGGIGQDPRGMPRNYNGITRGGPRPIETRGLSHQARATHDFGEMVIELRSDALSVLEGMYAILDEYGIVTVSDMYRLAGYPSEFTDRNWGWEDLMGATARPVRGGYLLDLPRPQAIH